MIYVGIDPGKVGAVACLAAGSRLLNIFGWNDASQIIISLRHVLRNKRLRVAVEDTHAQPRFGAKSSYQFGYHCGVVAGMLMAHGVQHEFVRPREWQRMLRRADGKTTKARARALARRLWPQDDVDSMTEHAIDALLIAEWLRRREARDAGRA